MAPQENTMTDTQYQISPKIPAHLFRTYDIRGVAGENSLDANLAFTIGLAFGSEAISQQIKAVIVGRDGRLTGPELKKAFIAGVCATGCDVIDIGIVPTPLVYFATHRLSTNTGAMITASHNPAHHNGFKMVLNGKTVSTAGVQNIYQRCVKQAFVSGAGQVKKIDVIDDYINYVVAKIQLARPLKVVVDCGNGVAAVLATKLYRQLGCEVVELFCEVDGRFPNHHPDPTVPENLQTIIATVKKEKADIGLAFDGDADRLGVVTNQGEIIWPDRQIMLYSKDLLTRHPGADIVFDVKCSSNLAKVIAENGGNPVMFRTGHSILKNKMHELGAPLAGEMSGHVFFAEDWFGFDDGPYVGARLLQILANDGRTSSEVFADLPDSVNTPELKLAMAEERKADFMQRLLNDADFGDAERITIDGLRVEFGYGWGLIRPSNTSPNLIVRFEADTQANLDKIKQLFRQQLLQLDADLNLPF